MYSVDNMTAIVEAARKLEERGDYAQAVDVLLEQYPGVEKPVDVYRILTRVYEGAGRMQDAIDASCRVLELAPEDSLALDRLAHLQQGTQESQHALPVGLSDDEIFVRLKMASRHVKDMVRFLQMELVFMNLTSYCNYRCRHCYHTHGRWKDVDFRRNLIPLETIRLWLENIDRGLRRIEKCLGISYDRKKICIQPQGDGEPLLHPHFAEVIRAINQYGFSTRLTTNASMLYGERADALFESTLNTLHVSLDAASSDLYRRFRVGGNYEKVVNNLESFIARYHGREQRPSFEVSFCCTPYNISDARKFAEYWISRVNAVWFQRFCDTTRPVDTPAAPIVPLVARHFCPSLPGRFMIDQDGGMLGCVCGHIKAGNLNELAFEEVLLASDRIELFKAQEEGRFADVPACADCTQWYSMTPLPSKGIRIGGHDYKLSPGGTGVYIFNLKQDRGRKFEEYRTLDSPDWLFPLEMPDGTLLYRKDAVGNAASAVRN